MYSHILYIGYIKVYTCVHIHNAYVIQLTSLEAFQWSIRSRTHATNYLNYVYLHFPPHQS